QVARCALSLREVLPTVPMAIATGRSEVGRPKTTGDAIERAAALLDAARAKAPRIALDEVTAALLDPRFEVVEDEAGLRLVALRLVAPEAGRLLGKVTAMVGREWELGSIENMFRGCVDEREARAVLVTGAAGMGKSRLAFEAAASLRQAHPGLEVWW